MSAKELFIQHWPWLVGALVVLLVAVLVVWLVRRRRRRGAPAPVRAPRPQLLAAFRRHASRLPREVRRALPLYRPIFVFGEPSSGKTALIDQHTDWRGQSALFRPSTVDDPNLQIYQGGQALVLEVAPPLLTDQSAGARKAFLKLLRAMRDGKPPRVVVALSAVTLQKGMPDALVRHAQAVRGKLDVMARVFGRPVPVSLAITHMDQLPGFTDVLHVTRELQRPLVVDPGEHPTREDLVRAFEALDGLLPVVLRERGAVGYVQAGTFVRELPSLLTNLGTFVAALQAPDPLVPEPRIAAIGLVSTREPAAGTWDPFEEAISSADARRYRPNLRHALAALALGVLGMAWLVSAYLGELDTIEEGYGHIDAYAASYRDPAARARLTTFLEGSGDGVLRALSPSFFQDDPRFGEAELHRRFLEVVRSRVLLPEIADYEEAGDGLRALYMLALLYAREGNALGDQVLQQASQWAEVLGLPDTLIEDYVRANVAPRDLPLPLDDRSFKERFPPPAVAQGAEAKAEAFLKAVAGAMARGTLDASSVEPLEQEAAVVLSAIDLAERSRRTARVAQLLDDATGLHFGSEWAREAGVEPQVDRNAVIEAARVVSATALEVPESTDLSGLVQIASHIAETKAPSTRAVTIGGTTVPLEAWHQAAVRTRLEALLNDFMAAGRTGPEEVFFGPDPVYADVDLDATGTGRFFHAPPAIAGVYTARAFADRVRPPLEKLPKLLLDLPVAKPVRERFAGFVRGAADDYASGYGDAWLELYDSFGYEADNPLALKYALADLTRGSSPLRKMLTEIARNTALELPAGNPYLAAFAPVEDTFAWVRDIVPKPGESSPVLDGYMQILTAMEKALGSQAPDAAPQETPTLTSTLPPVGRMALSMHLDEEGAFDRQVAEWLAGANVPADWQRPFELAPAIAYRLGIGAVQRQVMLTWDELVQTYLDPVRQAFPFDPIALEEASAELVEAAFHPKGPFFTTFDAMIRPVVAFRRDAYGPLSTSRRALDLPRSLFPLATWAHELGALFFDKKGEPRPLSVDVRPLTLPDAILGWDVTLAYLQVGENGVYAFNQRPDWTPVTQQWWKRETANVGVTFERESQRVYRSLSVPEMGWSLYRLLKLGVGPDGKTPVWRWTVPTPEKGRSVVVGFELEADPWAPLVPRMPRTSGPAGSL